MRFKDHDLEVAQEEWFQEQLGKNNMVAVSVKPNPCIPMFGPGPEGAQCKTCVHLFQHHGKYYKCALRNFTRGPGSDHKVRWPACGKYEANG